MATRKSFYGKECKGGLSATQATAGYRLFYVTLTGAKNGAYRECYRAIVKGLSRSRWPRYVVVGVPKGGTNPHALFWTASKSVVALLLLADDPLGE